MSYENEVLYQIFRDGSLFRSFAAKGKALDYLAAAQELCPDSVWDFRFDVFTPRGRRKGVRRDEEG